MQAPVESPRSLRLPFKSLATALLFSSLIEFILIRTFSRLGLLLPKQDLVFQIYNALMLVGSVVFNMAAVLAVAFLGFSAYLLLRQHGLVNKAVSALLIILLQFSVLFLMVPPSPLLSILFDLSALSTLTVLAITFVIKHRSLIAITMISLVTGAYACSYYFKLAPMFEQLFSTTVSNNYGLVAFNLGEALAILSTPFMFIVFGLSPARRFTMADLLAPSTITATFSLAYLANPWITSIISTWTMGLTLYLPLPVYVAALWLFSATIVRAIPHQKSIVWGLLLILMAGRMLQLAYLDLLAVAGVLLLVLPISESSSRQDQVVPTAMIPNDVEQI